MKNEQINEEQKKFFEDFENTFNEKVISIDLAELRAKAENLKALKLKPHAGQISLWGLIVFCENKNYFYAPPKDNTIAGIIIRKKSEEDEKDQVLNLSELQNFKAEKQKTGILSFLNPEAARTVNCSCKSTDEENREKEINFTFICSSKAIEIAEKLNK